MKPHAHANPTRRRLLASLGGAALATGGVVRAQPAFPSRPIRVIVPYGTGGGTDILIRMLAPVVSASLGQSIVIENRPGAGSVLGTEMVARSPADGYTLLAVDSAILTNPGLRKLPFDTKRDLAGVTMMATAPVILVVHPSVPAKTLPELIELARSKPGMLNYASGGNGASTHLAGELIALRTGAPFVHVPYSNQGQAVSDAVAGHVPMIIYTVALLPHIRSGRLKAIAVTSEVRQKQLPDIGTAIEQGVPGIVANSWFGMVGPAGIPDPIRDRLYTALAEALSQPDIQSKLVDTGLQPDPLPAQTFRSFIERDTQTWREVAKAAGIKAD